MKVTKHTRKVVTGGRIRPVVAALVAVLGGVAAAGYFVDDALAAPGPAAPSITSEPSNPTTSTSAAFTFTDELPGVTFKCSLDSAAFATCSSGVSYSGLAQGSHTFKVEAVSGSSTSSATSYSWAIVPPTPTITSEPANPTTATSASFKYSDTLAGVSFLCSLNGASFSSCASSGVTYTVTNGGSNTFAVEAQVGSNTPSAAASYTWTVTTPTPTINSKPANPTNSTSATFTYSDTQAGDSFKCSLDGASYSTCPSGGITYSGLSNATHTFGVEAALGSGPASSAATYSWLVHTTAPTITLTFPANGGSYNAAGWAAGCSPVGVCGTASDPVGGDQRRGGGVAAVERQVLERLVVLVELAGVQHRHGDDHLGLPLGAARRRHLHALRAGHRHLGQHHLERQPDHGQLHHRHGGPRRPGHRRGRAELRRQPDRPDQPRVHLHRHQLSQRHVLVPDGLGDAGGL